MSDSGVVIKEGSNYKFVLNFRVQHEIVNGLSFVSGTRKAVFSSTDELVIGSYPPRVR